LKQEGGFVKKLLNAHLLLIAAAATLLLGIELFKFIRFTIEH
jgi:hypothetical protein